MARMSFAADAWTLRTVDFRSQRVALEALDDKQISVAITNVGADVVPLDRFLQIRKDDSQRLADRAGGKRWIARLTSGDQIVGLPASTSGETVNWQSPALGAVKLPMRKLVGIERVGQIAKGKSSNIAATDDVIQLANGDSVHGIIAEVNGTAVSIQPTAGGDATTVPLDSVVAIEFAQAPNTSKTATPAHSTFRITLSDSTTINCDHPKLDRGDNQLKLSNLSLQLAENGAPNVPLNSVVSIEQINGPVVWLSSIVPTENVQTSFLDLAWPTKFDSAVDGSPIRFGERTFVHGIGVHSYSRLAFPIVDPSMVAFRAQYAIDSSNATSESSLADVTVRIKLDGKVVHEQQHVQAGKISPVISLPIDRAKLITLEVDYGDNQDVQDRFNWIEPALLRFSSSENSTSATQPNRSKS